MRHAIIITTAFVLSFNLSIAQQFFTPPKNKILVVSGGGARGAWGVGLVSELYKKNGGYKAVFGTSTGSLMAPFILLQKFDQLEQVYSSVTQSDIFNQNPFKVKCDCNNFTVKTKLKTFKALKRFLFNKTFGESKNLLNLIHQKLTKEDFDKLIDYYHKYQAVLAVAVTNVETGGLEIKTDTSYTNSDNDYNKLCNWIWASANEPLFMSYAQIDSFHYVDGGLREVIPIEKALRYAISNTSIDTIEVIINNSFIPISQHWDLNGGGLLYGLERILGIYNLGTVAYNENYAELLAKYYNATHKAPDDVNSGLVDYRKIHIRFYFMPDGVAIKYPDELGFCKCCMDELIRQGKNYANSQVKIIDQDVDEKSIRAFLN